MVRTNSNSSNEMIDVMNLDELRKDIIDRLKDVDDVNYLNELRYLVWQMSYGPFDPDPTKLTPKQLRLLKESVKQIERGECYTLDEEIRDIDKWLEENRLSQKGARRQTINFSLLETTKSIKFIRQKTGGRVQKNVRQHSSVS